MAYSQVRCSYPMCKHEAVKGETWIKITGPRGDIYFCPEHRFEVGKLIGKIEPIPILKFEQDYISEQIADEQLPGCFREYGVAGSSCKPVDEGGACNYRKECQDATNGGERDQLEATKEALEPVKPRPKIEIKPIEE